MIENLSIELARVVTVYKNRSGLFRWNGAQPTFSLKDVVRHHLFMRAESLGYTPVPQVGVLLWTLDLVCMRGLRPEYIFVIRESNQEDYRQLLLFPRSIEKVLIALCDAAVPKEQDEMIVVRVPKRPTAEINIGLSVRRVIADYSRAFKENYGFAPLLTSAQLAASAMKLANLWLTNANDLNFTEYCAWALSVKSVETHHVVSLDALIDKRLLENFRLSRRKANDSGEWTQGGWDSLDN